MFSHHRNYIRVRKELHVRLLGFTKLIGNKIPSSKFYWVSLAALINIRHLMKILNYSCSNPILNFNFGNLKTCLILSSPINMLIVFLSMVFKILCQGMPPWVNSTNLEIVGATFEVNATWVEHVTKSKWYFFISFPITLLDLSGKVITQS